MSLPIAGASLLLVAWIASGQDAPSQKIAERIVEDARNAGKRLADRDPGPDTQRRQQEVLKNLDALIKNASEPPPNPKDDGPSSSDKSKPDNSGMSTAEARKKRRQQSSGKETTQTSPTRSIAEGSKMNQLAGVGKSSIDPLNGPKSFIPRLPDIYKDVWGHLPDKQRLEMDLYFREQFMPRYSELLRQYYSSLAEGSGKPAPDSSK